MIIVAPAGGICNRITSLEATYHLCKRLNQKCIVLWNLKDELNCGFETIFQKIDGMKFMSIKHCDRVDWLIQKICKINNKNSFYYDFNKNYYDKKNKRNIDFIFNENLNKGFEETFYNKKIIYLKDPYYSYYGKLGYNVIKTNDSIMNLASDIVKDAKYFIGVHIRGTDHKACKEHVKVEHYISRLHEDTKRNPDLLIYLATDEIAVRERFRNEFGKRVLWNENAVLNRTSDNGIISGMIDLICLSKADIIYGSYASTFSLYAANMTNTPLKVCINGRWGSYCCNILDNIDNMSIENIKFE